MNSTIHTLLFHKIKGHRGSYQWKIDQEWKQYLPGGELDISIAFIPEESNHPGVYGDKKIDGYYFSEATAHFINIECHAGRKQKKTLQLYMPSNKPFSSTNGELDNGGRFLMFEDGELLFPANCNFALRG